MSTETVIRRRALRIVQDPKHPLYLFTLTAAELLQVADVSRVSRTEVGKLIGYQRPEVKKHVRGIIEYLDSGPVLFPNSVILALSSSVVFKEMRGPKIDEALADAGTIEIVLSADGQPRPAWIVDGQQRALALSRCQRRDLLVPVNAFIADDLESQKEQFLRINNTKPLPRGLVNELLPDVDTVLPTHLAARHAPAKLTELLNRDPESPFLGLIHRTSMKGAGKGKAVVSDTAVLQMIHESLTTPSGCLFPYRNIATGETDFAGVRLVLLLYWNGVKSVFPEAWGLPPSRSRLMHGAGIRAMGRLMDRVMGVVRLGDKRAEKLVRRELLRVKDECHWTEGEWTELGGLRWNEVQNVPTHVKVLSNFLVRAYLQRSRSAA
ncbi:DGQHR domain-containing protein DpdB [Anaeromyxobacter paludicola]|nr:DGQHR domain-containing protein DpdB [Anaeromyxobacter paludicola]